MNDTALLPPALEAIRAHEAEMVDIRHQIHANPELGFEENDTSDLVAARLERWGWEVHRGLGGTGVVGLVRNGAGPLILLRADMDGLPVTELTDRAAPPRASPSSFVRTTPVIPTPSSNALAMFTAS